MKRSLARYGGGEKGQALLLVIVFLVIGSLMLPPLLSYMGSSLKNDAVYERKSNTLYAADAGIEDGMWQVKYDGLEALSGDANYAYDFSSNWTYELEDPVNGQTTNVTISNVWLPSNITLSEVGLSAAEAKEILERDITDNTTNRLLVTGTALDEDDYRIKLDFYPAEDETSSLEVDSVGVWLPQGFTYDDGCNLDTFADTTGKYTETVESRPGGETVVWDFSAAPLLFTDLPPEALDPSDNPQSAAITFKYDTSDTTVRPAAVAWFVTSGNISTDIPLVWDIDTRYYRIASTAGGTEIETYASRSEMRNLYTAFSGDYAAIGNSLMTDDNSNYRREHWHSSSNASLSSIPEDATVTHAYLYWSGYFDSGFYSTSYDWGPDDCNDMNDWDGPNKYWDVAAGKFVGDDQGGGTDTRYLTMANCVDLDGYPQGTTIVQWIQSENGELEEEDALKFQFSSDNGTTWSEYITAFCDDIYGFADQYYYYIIPGDYLTDEFKMRFYLDSFNGSGEYCEIDNIAITQITGTADTVAQFTIDGYDSHTEDVSALVSQVLGNASPFGSYSFACRQDVTDLVKAHSERGASDNPTGNGAYTVGNVASDVDDYLSYCGWSLIVIYHSPDTAGHQLYLWNTFAYSPGGQNLDFDGDGEPGGHIEGFVVPEQIEGEEVAARLTCFVGEGDANYDNDFLRFNDVKNLWDGTTTGQSEGDPDNCWNSCSVGMDKDGIDVDTFTIYWDDDVLHADDTEATIDLNSETDNYNLIYIILSVRSETTVSGTTHYVISG